MAELSPRALILLRIHARQYRQFGRFPIFEQGGESWAWQHELKEAGLIEVTMRRPHTRAAFSHPYYVLSEKGKAFCKMAGYPNE